MFIKILFKMLLFKGGVLIYAEHCIFTFIYIYIYIYMKINIIPLIIYKYFITNGQRGASSLVRVKATE